MVQKSKGGINMQCWSRILIFIFIFEFLGLIFISIRGDELSF